MAAKFSKTTGKRADTKGIVGARNRAAGKLRAGLVKRIPAGAKGKMGVARKTMKALGGTAGAFQGPVMPNQRANIFRGGGVSVRARAGQLRRG